MVAKEGTQARRTRRWIEYLTLAERELFFLRRIHEAPAPRKLKLLSYLSERIGEKMTAVVTGVESFGLFVQGIELPAEGLVHVDRAGMLSRSAPEGRKIVATGGARSDRSRTKRNPWSPSHPSYPAPAGAAEPPFNRIHTVR